MIPVYEAVMPDGYWSGILNISLVDEPAIESYFSRFSEEKQHTVVRFDEEKKTVVGALLIPDKLIFRRNPDTGEEFFVKHSKEVISEMRDKLVSSGTLNSFSLHHETYDLEGWKIKPQEIWIKDFDSDKSNEYGFNEPVGTLFLMAKINDDNIWKRIKEGEFNGFSIESIMNYKFEKMERFLFSKLEVGLPVMKENDGNVELFVGKFEHEKMSVETDENGIITSVEPIEDTEDKTKEDNKEDDDINNNAKDIVEKAYSELKETIEEFNKVINDAKPMFEQLSKFSSEIKSVTEGQNVIEAMKLLASKQEQVSTEGKVLEQEEEPNRLQKIEAINKFLKIKK